MSNKLISRFIILIFFLVYWLFVWKLERIDYSQAMPQYLEQLVQLSPFFDTIVPRMMIIFEMLSPRVLRHLIPLLVAWWLARDVMVRFILSFYEVPDSRAASSFLKRLTWPALVRDKPLSVSSKDFDANRQTEPILAIGGPGQIEVALGETVVTEHNGEFIRVLGPGVHRLEAFEHPVQVIDVRPQERIEEKTEIVTADGIGLTTDISISFKINPRRDHASQGSESAYDEDAIKYLAYAQAKTEDEVIYWDALPLAEAVRQLSMVVSKYNLDDLFHSERSGIHFYHVLASETEKRTRDKLSLFGIQVISARLGLLKLPKAVTDQHIDFWRSSWNIQRRIIEAEGQARAVQLMEIARAQAEAIMLEAFFEGIRRAQQGTDDVESKEILALRLIEALEMLAQQSQRMVTLPEMLLPLLASLRQEVLYEGNWS